MSTPRTASRAAARPPSEQPPSGPLRSRPIQIAVVAASAVLLLVAALVFFLARGGDDDTPPPKRSVLGNVQMVLGGINNVNAGGPATLPEDAANQIMQLVGVYVDRGLVVPVKQSKPPENVAELFDAGTQAAIQGLDKDVLFENGQPERTGDFKPAAEPVIITALSDGNGQFVLATANLNYVSEVGVKGGTLKTVRTIALTVAPEGGAWKITGYDVGVAREGAQVEVPNATAVQ
jgi:hypothetical protein